MISYNIDASGDILRVNFGVDISTATLFTMTIEPSTGALQELTPTLGTSDTDVGDETFLANQFVEYTIKAAQFDYIGRWRVKATATLSGGVEASDYTLFRVMT